MPFYMMYNLQNSNSPMMEFLIFFHDLTLILAIMILLLLMVIFFMVFKMNYFCYSFPESQSLEDIWLLIPIIFLFFIGFPSIKNLYMHEEFNESDMNFKVMGHQWYWSYEFSYLNLSFDSIMNDTNYKFRLMETFNHLVVPVKCMIRFLVSSEDVIHSWTVPSLGIKVDATPGRVSQCLTLILRPSLMLGQCSEICGSNHSFMPIFISSNSINNFLI